MVDPVDKVSVPDQGPVSVRWAEASDGSGSAVILAHGAGGSLDDPLLRAVQEGLARAGHACVTFNFPYREKTGRRPPDRAPVLLATWRAVAAEVRARWAPRALYLGGKSMGGRMASLLAAEGYGCSGLVFLGYPLHPARRTDRLRVDHFPAIGCRSLFIQGDRDALCDLPLLKEALPRLGAPASLHVVAGADHSFKLPKRLGRPPQAVVDEIVALISQWIEASNEMD